MAKKRATKQQFRHENGFGSIVRLPGNRRKPYAVRITTGWKDGKQVRKYLGYYPSEADALIALAEYHKGGFNLDLSKLTLAEFFDRWYSRIEPTATKTVLENHKMAWKRLGDLGKKPVKDVKADHIRDWLKGIDLKPATKARLKSTLHQVYEYAVENDVVYKNPVKFVKIEEKSEKVGAIFTDQEINYLWENVDAHVDNKTLLILIYTGMRIGELLNLKLEDMHLDEGYVIGGSKTEAGRDRVIPIHNKILPIVKERVEKYKHLAPNTNGDPSTYISINHRINKLMEKLGWEHKIHDTRKTAISLMHRYGVPLEVIRVIVGHSGKGVTETVYLYKNPKELVDYINKVEL